MSPPLAEVTSSRSSECMRNMRGTRSFFCMLEVLMMVSPVRSVPWYTRMYVS